MRGPGSFAISRPVIHQVRRRWRATDPRLIDLDAELAVFPKGVKLDLGFALLELDLDVFGTVVFYVVGESTSG